MPRPLACVAAAVALAVGPDARAQSENCSLQGQVGLIQGSYDLPLHATATATHKDGMVMNVVYAATVQLEVDKNGITSAKADAKIDIHATASLKGAGSMNIDSSSSGALETSASSNAYFELTGVLEGSGSMSSPMGGMGAEANGPEILKVDVAKALCESASGTFHSRAFDATVEALKAKGFAVASDGAGSWSLGESDEARTEVDALKRELARIQGMGDAAAAADKLVALRDTLRSKSPNLESCLVKFWRDAAMRTMLERLAPKLEKLSRYPATGEVAGLDALFEDALAVDRQYVRLGIDVCTDNERTGFDILAARISAMITRAIKSGQVVDILEFDKQFQLVGGVERGGSTRAWDAIRQLTAAELKRTRKAFRDLVKPLDQKGGPGVRCDDPAVRQALQEYLAADKQFGMVGGASEAREAGTDGEQFMAKCTK